MRLSPPSGHDYIGTEHLLLGVIDTGSTASAALAAGLGLTSESAREHLKAEFAEIQAERARKENPEGEN